MPNKNELLSIGEMAKLTGAGIQALRYYERKNILKPVYIDPYSGYRYYTFEQAYCVEIISVCVELDIPLKELDGLFDSDDQTRIRDFFARNKEAAEKKLKLHNLGLSLMNKALKKIELNMPYKIGQIYSREMPEKFYYVKPCDQPLKNINRLDQFAKFQKEAKASLDIDNVDESMVLMEYGFLCEHLPKGTQYYVFAEIPKCMAGENTITIASGAYFFRQDKKSRIENAPEIFGKYLEGKEHFLVIEVEELVSGKSRIDEPIYELRLIRKEPSNCTGR